MISLYTAAALVLDNKTLAHPDNLDSIPISANQEDLVSMGENAARHALEIISNLRNIPAIGILTAAQVIDLQPNSPYRLDRGIRVTYQRAHSRVAFMEHDRALPHDIQALTELRASGAMLAPET